MNDKEFTLIYTYLYLTKNYALSGGYRCCQTYRCAHSSCLVQVGLNVWSPSPFCFCAYLNHTPIIHIRLSSRDVWSDTAIVGELHDGHRTFLVFCWTIGCVFSKERFTASSKRSTLFWSDYKTSSRRCDWSCSDLVEYYCVSHWFSKCDCSVKLEFFLLLYFIYLFKDNFFF